MVKEIDEKLDQLFNKSSLRYGDKSIWNEALEIAKALKETNPGAYFYEVKRLMEWRNCTDYAYEQGFKKGEMKARLKSKKEFLLGIAKSLKAFGISNEIIAQATEISIDEINNL